MKFKIKGENEDDITTISLKQVDDGVNLYINDQFQIQFYDGEIRIWDHDLKTQGIKVIKM